MPLKSRCASNLIQGDCCNPKRDRLLFHVIFKALTLFKSSNILQAKKDRPLLGRSRRQLDLIDELCKATPISSRRLRSRHSLLLPPFTPSAANLVIAVDRVNYYLPRSKRVAGYAKRWSAQIHGSVPLSREKPNVGLPLSTPFSGTVPCNRRGMQLRPWTHDAADTGTLPLAGPVKRFVFSETGAAGSGRRQRRICKRGIPPDPALIPGS